jgi:hypothetical protein
MMLFQTAPTIHYPFLASQLQFSPWVSIWLHLPLNSPRMYFAKRRIVQGRIHDDVHFTCEIEVGPYSGCSSKQGTKHTVAL